MEMANAEVDEWIPYKDREEWADVTPVYHGELERAVVNIAYTDRFAEVFAYFRAILEADERSERAYQLTLDCVKQNPANYTVWYFRRILIKALNKDLQEELDFCGEEIEENPKNYQVWHHRSVLIEELGREKAEQELSFTNVILGMDAKNYHAWQHRQWVVKQFGLFKNELDLCNEMLRADLRNNSAWNYRYFVIKHTTGFVDDVVKRETEFTQALIRKAPHNESAWNYLSGILFDKLTEQPGVWEFCEELYGKSRQDKRSSHLLVFMLDYLDDRLEKNLVSEEGKRGEIEKLVKICDELIRLDPVRKAYWNYLKRGCQEKYVTPAPMEAN